MRKTVLAFLILALANPCLAKYSGGTGEPNDPYQIATAEDLNDIGNHAEDFNKSFLMTNDIDMSAYTGTQYKIIGNYSTPFTGIFDGSQHIIHNLTYKTNASYGYVGLFGAVKNAEIKNLGLEDVNISSGGGRTSSLAAFNDSSVILNCYSTGSVGSAEYSYYHSDTGGLVGYQLYGSITNCFSSASITCLSYDQDSYAGGIVGSQFYGNITNCHSTGPVVSNSGGTSYAGGLAAQMYDVNIINCYSTGLVTSTDNVSYAGGLAGYHSGGSITDSYSTSAVSSAGSARSFAGGLAGIYGSGTVTNCRSINSVSSSGGSSYAGGLFGICSGVIADCCNLAEVNNTGYNYYSYAGGIAGYQASGTLLRCRNSASVKSYGKAGGLAGYLENGTISECYNAGSVYSFSTRVSANTIVDSVSGGLVGSLYYNSAINNSYNTGSVESSGYKSCAGGLAGFSIGFSNSEIIKCYSMSEVVATGPTTYKGGLLGMDYYNGTVIAASFWDTQTSGLNESAGGLGLTTSQMQQTFYYQVNGWAGTTWTLDEGNDYPHLAWENAPGEFISDPVVSMAGTGTPEDPLIIESKDDFLSVCSGSFFWDKHYLLNTNIDLSDITYTRGLIGYDASNPFTGSFNGGGHIINNLKIAGKGYLGLFGCIDSNAIVSNLGVAQAYIIGTGENIGALVGYLDHSTVANCYAAGLIISDSNFVGGLVGYADYGSIINSYAAALVEGYDRVGGLLGIGYYASVTNCYAKGKVICTSPFFYSWYGGLLGENSDGTVTDSLWDTLTSGLTTGYGSGKTTAKMKTKSTFTDAGWDFNTPVWKIYDGKSYPYLAWEKYAGGSGMPTNPYGIWAVDDLLALAANPDDYDKCFILIDDINLASCSFTGAVIAPDTSEEDGFQGTAFTGVFDGADHKIVNLTINTNELVNKYLGLFGEISSGGQIKNLILENLSITAGDDSENIGGLAGYNDGGGISNCYSSGTVMGGNGVGGLVGINRFGNISQCFSNSDVSGLFAAGGLIGSLEDACVMDSYSAGAVHGNENTGGFVGINIGDCNIFHCYSIDSIQGSLETGGFAGFNNLDSLVDYNACFWTSSVNPGISGIGNSVNTDVIGLTSRQFKTKNTFVNAGWDFNNVWIFRPIDKYPQLASYNPIIVKKCKVSARWEPLSDSLSISGFLNALSGDFKNSDFVGVAISSQNAPMPLTLIFPVNNETFKNGKYRCSFTAGDSRIYFALDTKTSKFSFSAANIGLSGLSCPLFVQFDIGSFTASASLNEEIVNGSRKPIPIKLLMGVENSLRIDKFQVQGGLKPYTDKLTVKGGFSVREIIDMTTNDFVIKLGSQIFTVKKYNFMINKNGFTCSKVPLPDGSIASADFNFKICKFTLTIKNTKITAEPGAAFFSLNFAGFDEGVEIFLQ